MRLDGTFMYSQIPRYNLSFCFVRFKYNLQYPLKLTYISSCYSTIWPFNAKSAFLNKRARVRNKVILYFYNKKTLWTNPKGLSNASFLQTL